MVVWLVEWLTGRIHCGFCYEDSPCYAASAGQDTDNKPPYLADLKYFNQNQSVFRMNTGTVQLHNTALNDKYAA